MRFAYKCFLFFLLFGILSPPVTAQVRPSSEQTAAGIEFFEKKIRPVLVQNCFECHSHAAKKGYGDLYLDSRKEMLQAKKHGAAMVPGEPDKSRLIEALQYTKSDLQMPPKGKLPDAVLADFIAWSKMGAPWPEETVQAVPAKNKAAVSAVEKKKLQHWAWQPVRKLPPPPVKRRGWSRNPIDQFLLAKMEAARLFPAPYADRRTLIRRASFDLIGLPPTPQEVDAFLADKSPNAWEKVVDRLLANPHYGERWGRFWLDIARYGEDQAHSFEPRLYPQGFRYRDWVAQAFNNDMPYDRFVRAQIAADLLDGPDKPQNLPALGFFALGPVYYGDDKMFDQYDDRIDTLSRGFLGLTVACARCHDHKFDPISQKDYYGLAGVFASSAYTEVPIEALNKAEDPNKMPADRKAKLAEKQKEVDEFVREHVTRLRRELKPEIGKYLVAVWKLHNRQKGNPKTTAEEIAAKEGLHTVVLERWVKYLAKVDATDNPHLTAWQQLLQREDPKSDLSSSEAALADIRKQAESFQNALLALSRRQDETSQKKANAAPLSKAEIASVEEVLGDKGVLTLPRDKFDKLLIGDPKMHYAVIKVELERLKNSAFIHALTEGPKIANLPVLVRGNPKTPGEEAPRRFLAVLAGEKVLPFQKGSGRLELANAIADPRNPLTARVLVNRIWQHHFGTGIVRTTSNFGLLGEKPSHPELLDYLAAQFVSQGWSVKSLHKQIMLSAAYQMSSAVNRKNYEIDPDNRLLWRMNPRRLEIEVWRDSMLAVTGKLDNTIGGPSVSLSAPDNCRRTFYAAVSRHDLDPMLRLFDFPDPNVTADARTNTTVPLQQLFVLNSEFMVAQAKLLAAKLNTVPTESDTARIRQAFVLLYNRQPSDGEIKLGLAFLQEPSVKASPTPDSAVPPSAKEVNHLNRWERYTQVLLSANEFLFVD